MAATLRVELEVRDYDLWRSAFDKDAGGRERSGAAGTGSSAPSTTTTR